MCHDVYVNIVYKHKFIKKKLIAAFAVQQRQFIENVLKNLCKSIYIVDTIIILLGRNYFLLKLFEPLY